MRLGHFNQGKVSGDVIALTRLTLGVWCGTNARPLGTGRLGGGWVLDEVLLTRGPGCLERAVGVSVPRFSGHCCHTHESIFLS